MMRGAWLGLLGLTLAGCVGLDNYLVYAPQPGAKPYEAPPAPLQDLDLRTDDRTKIHARWAPNPKATGAVLYCHGNGGNIEMWGGAIKEIWRNLEESVLIFDYPGYGHSGGKPSEQGCYAAAQAAYQWLTEVQKIPADKIDAPDKSRSWGDFAP